jgi:hypothetical protein
VVAHEGALEIDSQAGSAGPVNRPANTRIPEARKALLRRAAILAQSAKETFAVTDVQNSGGDFKSAMLTARGSTAAAVDGNAIYVIGGNGSTLRLNTVEKNVPSTNTWTEKAPLLVGEVGAIRRPVGNDDCDGRRLYHVVRYGRQQGLRRFDEPVEFVDGRPHPAKCQLLRLTAFATVLSGRS